ncbi:glycosyltransferase family 2 protein [Larkinella sp. VNQ87]|uniref:glycosyltransferase family 2 protein n=1 Tax=Larkinella sp. VNQ87 TaxID=3400921 RepID=UPI003C0C58C0
METHFPEVTLLITHYNRSSSLERLLHAFRELNCTFGGIVVSDDGSRPEHLNALQALNNRFDFQLVTTPKNRGLANNINKGQEAVKTPYTLYVQEDFVPKATFAAYFNEALAIMNSDNALDIIRFYAYFPYPYVTPYNQNFSKMIFKSWPVYANHLKFYYYSDHPHLRRSSFLTKFGRYIEGIHSDKSEFMMCLSFIKKKGKGLILNDFTSMFDQKNTSSEPSTLNRANWRESTNPMMLFARWWYLKYRLLKNTFELAMLKE